MNSVASILLAEDREEDIILIQKSFKRAAIHNPLFIVRDGEEAINYLSGTGRFADRAQYPLPAMFLLDLKMPGTDGFDVLRWISTQPDLKCLRVIVLTCSESIRDVEAAYKIGASSFLVKPMDFSDTVEVVKDTVHYWLGRNMTSGPSASNQKKTDSEKN
jgi:CheY-like chemotaxis protein